MDVFLLRKTLILLTNKSSICCSSNCAENRMLPRNLWLNIHPACNSHPNSWFIVEGCTRENDFTNTCQVSKMTAYLWMLFYCDLTVEVSMVTVSRLVHSNVVFDNLKIDQTDWKQKKKSFVNLTIQLASCKYKTQNFFESGIMLGKMSG